MARNEEKHAGRLNRIWLQQLDEEKLKKNPPRPGLGSLNSASEIKKWIPSIKKDIDFYLKQSQVTCYPERSIREFSTKIENLTKEYKAYVRKLKEFQPQVETVPWTERAYSRKHKISSTGCEATPLSTMNNDKGSEEMVKKSRVDFPRISTPLLDNDELYGRLYGYQTDHSPVIIDLKTDQDQPLDFKQTGKNGEHKHSSENINNERLTSLIDQSQPLDFKATIQTKKSTDKTDNLVGDSLSSVDQDQPLDFKCDCKDKVHIENIENRNTSCLVSITDEEKSKKERTVETDTKRGIEDVEKGYNKWNCVEFTGQNRYSLNLPYSDSSDEDS